MQTPERVVMTPCLVPWLISSTASGVTLSHTETDIEAECTVTCGVHVLEDDNTTSYSGLVEISFEGCYFARVGPLSDTEGIESIGYEVATYFKGSPDEHWAWSRSEWRRTGFCPDSGMYVSSNSAWLESIPMPYRKDSRHFVIAGRDGYVELIARRFRWRWLQRHGQWVEEQK